MVWGKVTLRGSRPAILKAVTLTELASPLSQSFLSGCGAAGLTSTHLVPALPFPATPAKNVSKCYQMSPENKTALYAPAPKVHTTLSRNYTMLLTPPHLGKG